MAQDGLACHVGGMYTEAPLFLSTLSLVVRRAELGLGVGRMVIKIGK